jgi:hypothetical protein
MKVEFCERFTVKKCRDNPNKLYVFGDNLRQTGCKGQAIIRDEPNSFGIPTKREPSIKKGAFFSDKHYEYFVVKQALNDLEFFAEDFDALVFPKDGLGTGLARMEEKSPFLFKYMNAQLKKRFGVDYERKNM